MTTSNEHPTNGKNLRVKGHTLRFEGAPHVVNERGEVVRPDRNAYGGVGGIGRGLCSCGELGPFVDSGAKRRAWHREHKREAATL